MAWAPSIGDIITLYKLASDVWVGCQNAPEEFEAVQMNVCSIMCSVGTIEDASKNPKSKLNTDPTTRRSVRIHAGMCHKLLVQIQDIQCRYPDSPMTVSQRSSWYFKDKSKLYDKLGQLDKMVQNFSTYLTILGYVAPQDVEPEFDKTNDARTAANNAIAKSGRIVTRSEHNALMRYADRVSAIRTNSASREDRGARRTTAIRQPLECWTVDIVTARPDEDSVIGMPEKQDRCQDRLHQMIDEFNESSFKLPLGDGHERVKRILELKNGRELDHRTRWVYVAGRVVEYESIGADDSATQTVMVILAAIPIKDGPRGTRALERPHPTPAAPAADPAQVPKPRGTVTQSIPRPLLSQNDQFLRPPRAARQSRRLSDPGERRAPGPSTPSSSRGASPAPSDGSSVKTANSTIKRVHTEGRCKWAAKCQTKRCPKKHPPMCGSEGKCRSLTCNNEHPSLPRCPTGSGCIESYCNYDHGRRQCEYDPCMDDGCALRHRAGQKAVPGFWAIIRVEQDL